VHRAVDAVGHEGAGGSADHDQGRPGELHVHGPLLRLRPGHTRVQLPARARGEPRGERVLHRHRVAQLPVHRPRNR
jgi:hypothetical protein